MTMGPNLLMILGDNDLKVHQRQLSSQSTRAQRLKGESQDMKSSKLRTYPKLKIKKLHMILGLLQRPTAKNPRTQLVAVVHVSVNIKKEHGATVLAFVSVLAVLVASCSRSARIAKSVIHIQSCTETINCNLILLLQSIS